MLNMISSYFTVFYGLFYAMPYNMSFSVADTDVSFLMACHLYTCKGVPHEEHSTDWIRNADYFERTLIHMEIEHAGKQCNDER